MTIQTITQTILNAFNRNNDAERLVCDNESLGDIGEYVQDAIMAAHDGRLPNDTSYDLCYGALEYIAHNDADEDSAFDFADAATPVYSHVLLAWLCDHADNLTLSDDVLEEGCAEGIVQAVSIAYGRYAADVYNTMLSLVESLAEDEE